MSQWWLDKLNFSKAVVYKSQKQWHCDCGGTQLIKMNDVERWFCPNCTGQWSKRGINIRLESFDVSDDGFYCKDPNCKRCIESGLKKPGQLKLTSHPNGVISPIKEVMKPCTCPIIGLGILHAEGCIDNPENKK